MDNINLKEVSNTVLLKLMTQAKEECSEYAKKLKERHSGFVVFATLGRRQKGSKRLSRNDGYGYVIGYLPMGKLISTETELMNVKNRGGEFFEVYSDDEELKAQISSIKSSQSSVISPSEHRLLQQEKGQVFDRFLRKATELVTETEMKMSYI